MLKLSGILLVTALSTGCASHAGSPDTVLTDAQFISVMADLGAAAPRLHKTVLQKHHTTDAQLRAYVAAMAADPVALSNVFDTIRARLDRRQPVPDERRRACTLGVQRDGKNGSSCT